MTYSKRLKTLLGLSILGSTALSQATLVAHYKFDEGSGTTATDSAGGDQNAATNQGTIGWTPSGKIGGALDLPGNASLQVADAIGAGATAFTLSVWVNMDDNPGYDGIFSARDTENWGLNVNGGSAANLAFDYRFDNPGVSTGGSAGVDSPNGSAIVGTWHHIAMTWATDGTTGTGVAYLDGVQVATAPGGIESVYSGHLSTWNIGDDPCCAGRELNAQLDDLAVWDEALSPADIAKITAGGNNGLDAPSALAAVPEPSTSLLGALAALALLRRRR
ncbi:LamG domain-containing protein [Verrucomicrobiaceae bacterium 227]